GVLLHAYSATDLDSGGGHLAVTGTAYGLDAVGVYLDGIRLVGGIGDVAIDGSAPMGYSVLFANGAGISTTSGAISLVGEGANFGLDLGDGVLATGSGDVYLYGNALATGATAGVRMTGGGIVTNGGDITVIGNSAGGVGVQLGDSGLFAIGSSGGAIMIDGSGVTAGVMMMGAALDSNGGGIGIQGIGSGAGATGVYIDGMAIHGGAGDVSVTGSAPSGSGVRLANGAGITTTSGAITLIGIGDSAGLSLDGGGLTTGSGHIDLRGRGLGAGSDGLLVGGGASIVTASGGIELSGEGGSGSGLSLAAGSTLDAGTGLIVLRAGNDGSSDAIRLQGAIHSGTGVNVRPGGVDANGALTERVDDNILLGVDAAGFALSASELALIDSPQLVIGSSLHAGAIQVLGAVSRDGNLTLQNNGGSGGIDLQASLDVGNGTLALSSGGSITQASAGAITAHSLLVNAGGDVLLGNAQNNVAATTLAGSAGGAFQFQDVDTLAIGNVSAIGFDASSGGLSSLGANGITAGSDVLVRNLTGDMILNSDVSGANLDLVTAGRLQNLGGASLIASVNWRVWANTWVGESRGGLAGSGNLPNLYGCTFLGSCGVTVPGTDNHFIYIQQPTALITFDDFSREYGLANPVFTFTVTGAILGDSAANVASGSASTSAMIGSDVGSYAITGTLTSAAGYRIQMMPGSLAITPAMLFFTADSVIRYFGTPNPTFSGMVSGFRNGDTVTSVFGAGGIWTSPAGTFTSIGFHPIYGGTSARNYVFSQAPGNATALQIIPMSQPQGIPFEEVHETINTYVYDRNFGGAPVCALSAALENEKIASTGDELSSEWTKVRSRPNLTNCFDTERKNGCSSF
ncbi:MAG: MBG domain-containing protein, partial [Thermomonas sp.]